MATPLRDQNREKEALPELKALPDGWLICIDADKLICYRNELTRELRSVHPTLGVLPKPWAIRYCNYKGKRVPRYYNSETNISTTENPRHNQNILKLQKDENKAQREMDESVTAGFTKMKTKYTLDMMKRSRVGEKNIRNSYNILKVLDWGTGDVGGMNGGVFVVKLRDHGRLSVEKRFNEKNIREGAKEIRMLHRLRHGSISLYTAGFITPNGKEASVYVEFCDRGSLENLIKAYQEHRMGVSNQNKPEVPEKFIWHAFAGLCDGLAYLYGGRSYMAEGVTDYSVKPGWTPVLHRDMKPDNVLLRSRDTLGSKRYWYCVLSDFGLACEDLPDGDENEDKWQRAKNQLGTNVWFAPELLYTPYPRMQREFVYFAGGYRHSEKSDLWSLGASMFNLADCGPTMPEGRPMLGSWAHMDLSKRPPNVDYNTFFVGTLSRKQSLDVSKIQPTPNRKYSKELREAILTATQWNPETRPDPIEMVQHMKRLMAKAGCSHGHAADNPSDELPSWASKVHAYHSRKPIPPEEIKETQKQKQREAEIRNGR